MPVQASPSRTRISQAEASFLIEQNADGILVVDQDGAVLFANPAAERLFGRTAAQLVGTAVGIPAVHGETAEIVVHRPDGNRAEAEIRVVETRWEGQRAWLASVRDVSERRIIEERLRHIAKMEAIGRLTAGVAHDFNNLLTVIIGNLDMVRRHGHGLGDRAAAALENATAGAHRAAALTQRLLAFSRRQPLAPKPLDVNTLVSGMSDLLGRTLGEAVVVRTLLDASRLAFADPTEFEAALLNLAVNARDAMPGGGTLTIRTADLDLQRIDVTARGEGQPGPQVIVSVTDTGTGMSPEVISQAMEPFFTTKGIGHGTGLGLSQVYGFVRQSGGHVAIESEIGRGTTVRLHLPAHAGSVAPAAQSVARTDIPVGTLSEMILVVEDDEDVRRYAATCLRELGYRVLEAADGSSALQVIEREGGLRLLLTDLGLPGELDGRALADRASQVRPDLQILLITAYAGSTLGQDGQMETGMHLLPKPFGHAALALKVRELLDASRTYAPSILVVEDEALIRMLLVDTLAEAGFHVVEAATAGEALRLLERQKRVPKAAVLDVELPDGRGDELVERIRATHPELLIVLTTGHADSGLHRPGDPRLRVLGKPFRPEALVGILNDWGILH